MVYGEIKADFRPKYRLTILNQQPSPLPYLDSRKGSTTVRELPAGHWLIDSLTYSESYRGWLNATPP